MHPAIKLLDWYKKNGRDLPWRKTCDPYKILVSEIMLQQTQVKRVLEFYNNWIKQFPNWSTLSKASNADVIHAWAGLGYNRRAIMLRNAARYIEEYEKPKTTIKWQKIKGIGPYTAAAIAVFAHHEPIMPIDTNIRRVLGRLVLKKPFPELKNDRNIQQRTKTWLEREEFWLIPQALFDLSTFVCKKDPLCEKCPLRSCCPIASQFIKKNITIPRKSIKKAKENIRKGKKYPDRIYRGRILALVRKQEGVSVLQVSSCIDKMYSKKDMDWVRAMIDRMIRDQFIEVHNEKIYLKQ